MLIVTAGNQCECGVYSIIRDLLQWNVAGIPTIHQRVNYDFDPEVSQKRREQFYEVISLDLLWHFTLFQVTCDMCF